MPIPKPRENEVQAHFIARCMGDDMMNEEYPEEDQRAAICYQTWRDRTKADEVVEHKAIYLKAGEEGAFLARIATLGVIDLDNDVTLKDAFPESKEVLVSAYQHGSWQGALPVGRAVIKVEGPDVLAKGQFNLQITSGRDHYEAIKFAGNLQEWSYAFKAIEWEMGEQDGREVRFLKKVEPFEISPVLKGAGIETGTLVIKERQFYADQAEAALAAARDLAARTKSLADLRRKEGRALSEVNRKRLLVMIQKFDEIGKTLKGLLETEPNEIALKLLAEFTFLENQILEVA